MHLHTVFCLEVCLSNYRPYRSGIQIFYWIGIREECEFGVKIRFLSIIGEIVARHHQHFKVFSFTLYAAAICDMLTHQRHNASTLLTAITFLHVNRLGAENDRRGSRSWCYEISSHIILSFTSNCPLLNIHQHLHHFRLEFLSDRNLCDCFVFNSTI